MNSVLFSIVGVVYPLSCVVIPCAIYQVICFKRWPHHAAMNKVSLLWRWALMLYLFLMMRTVGLGSVWDIAAYGLQINWNQINLVPFGSEGSLTYVLNVALFVPLGILLPLISGKYRAMPRTVLAGFLLSLSIELGQLFNHRLTDIDDIFMNTLGAVVGFGLWFLLNRRRQFAPRERDIFPDSAAAYLLLAVLGNFFLYNWRWTVLMYR